MPDDAVSASAKGASFLILLQIGSRAITFALNQILLRFLSPELLGVSVQLELFKIGTMYFSRESLRVAAERRSDGGVQAAINLSYLAILAGLPIGAIIAEWYLSMSYGSIAYFALALRVNQLAAFVELLMEPAYTAVQQNLLYKFRAAAEGSSVILKTLTVFSLVFWSRSRGIDLGVLPFAAGELVNSITLTCVYWVLTSPVAREKKFSLLPKKMESSNSYEYVFSIFSKPLLWLISSLYLQLGIKWLLTEGDKILIGALASLEENGMYALSANYGGLVARMVFQPIETASRNLFANLCAISLDPSESTNGTASRDKTTTKSKYTAKPKADLKSAAEILILILHSYAILSLMCFVIGPPAAPQLLRLVAGSRWSDSGAGEVLGTYCYYIPLLAINGVSEAFVAATASTKDLRTQTFWMTGFSALFGLSAWLFLRVMEMGAKGLVWANCVNMGLRVLFNLWFVTSYFEMRGQEFKLMDTLPSMYTIAFAAIFPPILFRSQYLALLTEDAGELVRVACVGAALAGAISSGERIFLKDCYNRFIASN